jgi:hypothetical protein
MAGALRRERRCQRSEHAPCLDDASSDTTTTTTTGIHATDQLLVSTTLFHARLSPLLLRARRALHDLDSTPQEPGHYDVKPRPGGTELRHEPPHCSRDLGDGHGAGSGHLPRLQPPTCSRSVSGVGLGLSICGFLRLCGFLVAVKGPCFPTVSRSAICDFLSVNGCFSLFVGRSCTRLFITSRSLEKDEVFQRLVRDYLQAKWLRAHWRLLARSCSGVQE